MPRKKKKSKKPLIIGGLIIFFMISSAFAVMLGGFAQTSSKTKYDGITFTSLQNGEFRARVDGKLMDFDFTPDMIEGIELDPALITRLKNAAEVDVTYDYDSEAANQIALGIFQMQQSYFKDTKFIREGATKENEFDQPIITCDDASPEVPVILFELGDDTGIIADGDCIIATASRPDEIAAVKDRIVFSMLGVMN